MTDQPDNAPFYAPAPTGSGDHPAPEPAEKDASDNPLEILLQTSAAAEALQKQFGELKSRRAELIAEQQQLNADRTAFETRARSFAEQVARDRANQRELEAELNERKQQLDQQTEALEQQQQTLVAQTEDLESRREQLHEAVNSGVARERELLQRQQTLLEEERERLAVRTEELERRHADRMEQVDNLLQEERESMRDTVRSELADEIAQLQRERQEWDSQQLRESHELKEQAEDLQQQRELFGEQLETEHNRLRDEIEKRRQTLLTEQSNLQRRYRFQFEHLSRARDDFEEELRELRKEQQIHRSERARFDQQHRLQLAHLRKIRDAIMLREASLDRERKVVERSRISAELDLRRQQERIEEERSSVARDLDSRSRRLRQAEQASAETAQRVEQRLRYVNQMRAELDAKQRDILEQRLLLEELQAGQESATVESPGYQQARRSVEAFFAQLQQPLQSERDRLQQQASELAERQEQFRKDRNELERWFAQQEQKLAAEAAGIDSPDQSEKIAALEKQLADLQLAADRQQRESEKTTRDLLDKIAAAGISNFGNPDVESSGADDKERRNAA